MTHWAAPWPPSFHVVYYGYQRQTADCLGRLSRPPRKDKEGQAKLLKTLLD